MMQASAQTGLQNDSESSWLVWTRGHTSFAIELSRVFQVIESATVFPVPLSGSGSWGVIYYQEQAIPVLRPEMLKGTDPGDETSRILPQLILLVEWDRYKMGIPADRVSGVVNGSEIDKAEHEKPEPHFPPGKAEGLMQPMGTYEGKTLYILNMEGILSALRDFNEPQS
jgi:chemotaxis signal transduction protein